MVSAGRTDGTVTGLRGTRGKGGEPAVIPSGGGSSQGPAQPPHSPYTATAQPQSLKFRRLRRALVAFGSSTRFARSDGPHIISTRSEHRQAAYAVGRRRLERLEDDREAAQSRRKSTSAHSRSPKNETRQSLARSQRKEIPGSVASPSSSTQTWEDRRAVT